MSDSEDFSPQRHREASGCTKTERDTFREMFSVKSLCLCGTPEAVSENQAIGIPESGKARPWVEERSTDKRDNPYFPGLAVVATLSGRVLRSRIMEPKEPLAHLFSV